MPCIEGNPFIIRFKTRFFQTCIGISEPSIEGNPFIIRFKTKAVDEVYQAPLFKVLKVIHL